MTERERLIGLLNEVGKNILNFPTENFTESLADFLIANGVIALLVKPGDTVYAYNEYFGILPYLVGNFHIGYMGKEKDCLHYEAAAFDAETDELLDDMDFDLEDIGKDVFLTRKEAEKALAERQGKNEKP